ncbi:PocR ligand-binding domain-containing protein [Sporolactobacillus shoreicorticis]|uniref:PocR ligand-binding domain-containing protein n=1 Tax=Sporolactobacillus shoreicorticis TaxID=1923877 RepID=A0ABW5S3V0_9BACL|nr:PocR ligand-binding domain-containing protein [Sporolactobacillus shoreicorticis]MCO7124444.1 PocR ligand-binding domain-containing protein [Sporolactobacillus shoreicorticis]
MKSAQLVHAAYEDESAKSDMYTKYEQKIINEVGLRRIIDVPSLQKVQDDLASITGLSMVTVDSKGIPITEESGFSTFCAARRKITSCKENCFFSDAYGGLKAAISNSPYVYRCPAGLVDCAVPIFVSNQPLGAVLMGQVRCPDSGTLENVEKFVKEKISKEHCAELMEKYEQTTILEINKIKMIGNMIYFIIKEMMERRVAQLVQDEIERTNFELVDELSEKEAQLNKIRKNERRQLKTELAPQFLMSIMNAISSLSILEGARQTNELVCLFSNMLRYNFETKEKFVALDKELVNLDNYLGIQRIRFADRFDYQIVKKCQTRNKKVPYLVFFPFVENAILHGILPGKKKGKVVVTVEDCSDRNYLITIEDNGRGMDQEDVDRLLGNQAQTNTEKSALKGISIYNTRKRLVGYFGKEYDIKIQSRRNFGFTVYCRIPAVIEEHDGDDEA